MESKQNNTEEVSTGSNENMEPPSQVSSAEPTPVEETSDKSPPRSASDTSVEDRNNMSIDENSVLSDEGTMDQSMESQKTNTSLEEMRDSPSNATKSQGDVVGGDNVENKVEDETLIESSDVSPNALFKFFLLKRDFCCFFLFVFFPFGHNRNF